MTSRAKLGLEPLRYNNLVFRGTRQRDLAFFSPQTHFFTAPADLLAESHHVAAWIPITGAIFDNGVAGTDEACTSLLCLQNED